MVENAKADGAGIRNFGGNATIFLTDAGVLLVDSKNDREHDDLIAKVKANFDVLIPGHGPTVGKSRLVEIRNKMVAVRERVRAMVRDKKTQDEIAQTIVKEFGWGQGGAAAQFAPMMQELR